MDRSTYDEKRDTLYFKGSQVEELAEQVQMAVDGQEWMKAISRLSALNFKVKAMMSLATDLHEGDPR